MLAEYIPQLDDVSDSLVEIMLREDVDCKLCAQLNEAYTKLESIIEAMFAESSGGQQMGKRPLMPLQKLSRALIPTPEETAAVPIEEVRTQLRAKGVDTEPLKKKFLPKIREALARWEEERDVREVSTMPIEEVEAELRAAGISKEDSDKLAESVEKMVQEKIAEWKREEADSESKK